MTFTGNEVHDISLELAATWTANYRDTITPPETIAHYFGGAALESILAQEGCVGIRLYYALDDSGQKQIIVVGVNEAGNDLYEGLLAERSVKCPQMCSAANPLNS
jgi:hypothetical protein